MPPSNSTGTRSPLPSITQNLWFLRVMKGSTTIITIPQISTFLILFLICSAIACCSSGLRFSYIERYSSYWQVPCFAFRPMFWEKPLKDRAELQSLRILGSERTEQASLISLNLPSIPGLESGWQALARRQYDFLTSLSVESLVTSRILQQSLEASNLGTSLQKRQAFLRMSPPPVPIFLMKFPNITIIAQLWPKPSPQPTIIQILTYVPLNNFSSSINVQQII